MPLSDAHRAELHAECLDRQAFIRECEREREGAAGDRRAAAAYDAQILEARDRIGEIDFLLGADQDERRDIPGPKPLLLAL